MQIIRVRYLSRPPLVDDLKRIFPRWGRREDGTFDPALAREDISSLRKKRHAFIKVVRNEDETLKHIDVYALVRDTFMPPLWLQGIVTIHTDLDPFTHTWLGHETPVPDAADEEPDNEVIT